MPAPIVDSIAKQTDATKAEVEKHWKDLEKQYKDKGFTGGRLYQAIEGTLKKMYKDKGYKPESKKERKYFQIKTKIVEDYKPIFFERDRYNSYFTGPVLKDINASREWEKIKNILNIENIEYEIVDRSPGNQYITIIINDLGDYIEDIIKEIQYSTGYIWDGSYNK